MPFFFTLSVYAIFPYVKNFFYRDTNNFQVKEIYKYVYLYIERLTNVSLEM